MDWVDVVFGGVAAAPVIVALVEFLKAKGMAVDYAPYVCGGLAVVAFVASYFLIPAYPFLAEYAKAIVGALTVFLTATGYYKVTKTN